MDNSCYSEPVMYLNMYRKWTLLEGRQRKQWIKDANINCDAMRLFASSANRLLETVKKFLGDHHGHIIKAVSMAGLNMHDAGVDAVSEKQLNMYRLVLTWSSDTLMRQNPAECLRHESSDEAPQVGVHREGEDERSMMSENNKGGDDTWKIVEECGRGDESRQGQSEAARVEPAHNAYGTVTFSPTLTLVELKDLLPDFEVLPEVKVETTCVTGAISQHTDDTCAYEPHTLFKAVVTGQLFHIFFAKI